MILAGGFGTRLQSALPNVPKALAPVGNLPFLYIQLKHWIDQGLKSFTFLLHHQADQIINFLLAERDGLLNNCKVEWLIEPIPLGTGGAVAYAIEQLQIRDGFLVTNADTWLGGGVGNVLQSNAPNIGVIWCDDASRYGRIIFDAKYIVTEFLEKKEQESGWINSGLYHLHPTFFSKWSSSPFSLELELFPELIREGKLKAVNLAVSFFDIGVPNDYYKFCSFIQKKLRE